MVGRRRPRARRPARGRLPRQEHEGVSPARQEIGGDAVAMLGVSAADDADHQRVGGRIGEARERARHDGVPGSLGLDEALERRVVVVGSPASMRREGVGQPYAVRLVCGSGRGESPALVVVESVPADGGHPPNEGSFRVDAAGTEAEQANGLEDGSVQSRKNYNKKFHLNFSLFFQKMGLSMTRLQIHNSIQFHV